MGWMDQAAAGEDGIVEKGAPLRGRMYSQPAVDETAAAKAAAPSTSRMYSQPAVDGSQGERPSTTWDVVKAGAAGVGRGAVQLAGLPGTLGDLISAGVVKGGQAIGVIPESWEAPKSSLSGEALQSDLASVTGGASEYRGKTTAGKYAGTIGEFVPGAMIGPGGVARKLLTGAAAPAVGSEFLGQKFEGYSSPWVEPAARLAGAILGGVAAGKAENLLRSTISPGGGADPARLAEAAYLRSKGVPVTAGQATGRPGILAAEADTPMGQAIAGAAPDSEQAKAFTSATMKYLGSSDDLATPQAMEAARSSIVGRMTGALDGIDVPPTPDLSKKVSEAKNFFMNMNPDERINVPLLNNVINFLSKGRVIPGDQLAQWRSNLGGLLYHSNKGVSQTAYMVREAIDEAIESAMQEAGKPERIEMWRTARDQYRNYLAVQDALKVTKAAGIDGIVTPKDLMAALAKQGKAGIVTGSRGDISDFARAGIRTMAPIPKYGKHGLIDEAVRRAGPIATAAGMGYGALQGAQWAGLSPLMTAGAAALAAGKPIYEAAKDAVRGFSMRPLAQRYLENQLVNSSARVSPFATGAIGAAAGAPSYFQDRTARKTGGRVGVNHGRIADQLVVAAERAKKGISEDTKPLLNASDDHIAHALEVANRSI